MIYKSSANPITKPNPMSSHYTWQYIYLYTYKIVPNSNALENTSSQISV
jgi:hypothetical protein